MHPFHQTRHSPPHQRTGFTLVELLMVIVVISVLATLTLRVVGGMIVRARKAKTETTIAKVSGLINERLQAFNRLDLRNIEIKWKGKLGGGAPPALITTMARKDSLYQAFPQNYSEAPSGWNTGGKTGNSSDSAEILYYILTEGPVFGVPPVGAESFNADEVGDVDGDQQKEFIDGWGQPLRFYRWPTRLVRPNGPGGSIVVPPPATAASTLITVLPSINDQRTDPDDPQGSISLALSGGAYPALGTSPAQFEQNFHTPDTWHTPLIISAGPDGQDGDSGLGLYEPYDTANFGYLANPISGQMDYLYDNISNLNQQPGGKFR